MNLSYQSTIHNLFNNFLKTNFLQKGSGFFQTQILSKIKSIVLPKGVLLNNVSTLYDTL